MSYDILVRRRIIIILVSQIIVSCFSRVRDSRLLSFRRSRFHLQLRLALDFLADKNNSRIRTYEQFRFDRVNLTDLYAAKTFLRKGSFLLSRFSNKRRARKIRTNGQFVLVPSYTRY